MAAVTIKTSAQAWAIDGSNRAWTARVLWDTGTALYALLQDSGASPRVRVLKADSRTAPTTFTEVDSGNNKAGTQNLSYDWSYDSVSGLFDVGIHTATNTVTHYTFDPATDTWGAGNGNASTAMVGYRAIRVTRRSDGAIVVGGSDSTDDSDLRYAMYSGGSWSTALFLSVTSTPSSRVLDLVADSSGYVHFFYLDMANTDTSWRSLTGSTLGTESDIDTTSSSTSETTGPTSGRWNIATISGTKYVFSCTHNISSSFWIVKQITLGGASASGSIGASISPSSVAGSAFGGSSSWYDNNTSTLYLLRSSNNTTAGGNVQYLRRVSTTWDAAYTTLVTGVSIELAPVGPGCAYVYQDSSNNVKMDWLVVPATNVSVNGSLATASGAAYIGAHLSKVAGALATGSGAAPTGSVKTGYTVAGAKASATAASLSGVIAIDKNGALSTATGAALAGGKRAAMPGALATASGAAFAGTRALDISGVVATGSAAALSGSKAIDVAGLVATADGQAYPGGFQAGYEVQGSLATATAQANGGTTQIDTGNFQNRYRFFQIRPLPQAPEEI